MAREKAAAVATGPDELVLTADTTVALFIAAAFLVWAVLEGRLILAFIAVSVGITAWMTRRRAIEVQGEFETGFAGYDFSMGNTSLRSSMREAQRIEKQEEKERKAREKEAEREREIEEKVDELLEKISREGMDSLTRRERTFLERASRRRS